MPVHLRAYGIAAVLLALAAPLVGQSTEAEIAARLKDKPLYIRGSWSDRTLRFDANGDLARPSKRSTFALNGFMYRSLKLKNGTLTISGKALGVEFLKDGPKWVFLPASERMIEIAAPVSGDFGPALDAIFADGLEALAPSLPAYWQPWVRKAYPAAFPAEGKKSNPKDSSPGANNAGGDSPDAMQVSDSVSAPRLLKRVDAQFDGAALDLKYSGSTTVRLLVEPDGSPSYVAVVRPLGLGLDEMALEAVQQYRFAPSMRGGKPVRVEVYVEVDFQIF